MRDGKYQILVIAPNSGVARVFSEAAPEMEEMDVEIHVGSMEKGVELFNQKVTPDHDVVISRADTASMIKEISNIPVVDVQINHYDILHAIKRAERSNEPFAVVESVKITRDVAQLKEVMQEDWKIIPFLQKPDLPAIMEGLWEEGIRTIIGGPCIMPYAAEGGMNGIQFVTGINSARKALVEALELAQVMRKRDLELMIYKRLMINIDSTYRVYDQDKKLLFSSFDADDNDEIIQYFNKALAAPVFPSSEIRRIRNDQRLILTSREIVIQEQHYYTFSIIQKQLPFSSRENNVRIYSRSLVRRHFLQHYSNMINYRWREEEISIETMSESKKPVILIGEKSVGKEQIAASIFLAGDKKNNQYYYVDFARITDEFWNYFIEDEDSPLREQDWTLSLRNLDSLSSKRIDELSNALQGIMPYTTNRFIFTYTQLKGDLMSGSISSMIDELGCMVIHIVPLRERKAEIQKIADVCLTEANMIYEKQILGFSDEAMDYLVKCDWPGNLQELQRVIAQAVQAENGCYIQKELLEAGFREVSSQIEQAAVVLNLNKSLAEINSDIAQIILQQCNGNQTKAAEQMGISRTTLWRMINR